MVQRLALRIVVGARAVLPTRGVPAEGHVDGPIVHDRRLDAVVVGGAAPSGNVEHVLHVLCHGETGRREVVAVGILRKKHRPRPTGQVRRRHEGVAAFVVQLGRTEAGEEAGLERRLSSEKRDVSPGEADQSADSRESIEAKAQQVANEPWFSTGLRRAGAALRRSKLDGRLEAEAPTGAELLRAPMSTGDGTSPEAAPRAATPLPWTAA